MTDRQIFRLASEALEYSDVEQYISDCYLSDIFSASDRDNNPFFYADKKLIEEMRNIWEVARMSSIELRKKSGLTQEDFGNRFCISKRTVESWDADRRNIPLHVKMMAAEIIGLLKVERK